MTPQTPPPIDAAPGEYSLLQRLFDLRGRGANPRTEALAGLVTFLTMAYIVAVNPLILRDAGLPLGPTVAATCLGAALPTLLMGLWANYPLALAPGMGLNALLTYTVVLGMKVPWPVAMGVVFVEGCLITLLVAVGAREAVMRAIPAALKTAIGVGIGLFIAFIGLQHAHWVVADKETLVTAGNFHDPATLVASAGLLLTAALIARRIPGALLLGILGTTLVAGIATAVTGAKLVSAPAALIALPDFSTFGRLNIAGALTAKLAATTFAFIISDFFDAMGTIVAIGRQAGLADENGDIRRLNRILLVDAVAAAWGGICCCSSVTGYVESAAGVGEGGRTGLASVVTGILFLLAMFFAPLIAAIPSEATAPALIVVGFLMLSGIRDLPFDRPEEALPAFLTLLAIPLTFSIARGIALGFLAYALLALLRGRARDVPPLLWVIAALFTLSLAL